jgi:hypothetical protein
VSVRIGRDLLARASRNGSLERLLSFDLSVPDVAALLDVPPRRVRAWCKPDSARVAPDGQQHPLPHGRLGASHEGSTAAMVFRFADVVAWAAAQDLDVTPTVMPATWLRTHAQELEQFYGSGRISA